MGPIRNSHTHLHILPSLLACLLVLNSNAQDLEPRSLSAMPTGGNFAIVAYGHTSGNILIDNTLPIEDLEANLNNVVLAYAHSLKLLNKLAKIDVIVPYSFGRFEGIVSDMDSST